MKNKLYVDFDGVIVNTIKTIVDLYNEDFKYYKKFKPIEWSDINSWNFKECELASSKYINTYFNQKRFFDRIKFMPNAKEVLEEVSKYYDITIVTAGYRPNLVGKMIWIEKNLSFCHYEPVNLKKYKDKSHINMEGGIFIDDCSNNLVTSNAEYKICFGDEYPWNKEWNGKRCMNWIDVYDFIK